MKERCKAYKDLNREIDLQIERLERMEDKALDGLICRLRNPENRLVLRLRYLDFEEWEDVIFTAYGSKPDFNEKYDNYKQRVFRHHKQALSELEALEQEDLT